ncbi:hypothetical protein ColTof3_04642 [Colletotrichum tofieldiae]|nr:hypothetical protein ColTof3_04642 [Colletotrichum tofieldiae]
MSSNTAEERRNSRRQRMKIQPATRRIRRPDERPDENEQPDDNQQQDENEQPDEVPSEKRRRGRQRREPSPAPPA